MLHMGVLFYRRYLMNFKETIYQLMVIHDIMPTKLISEHIENYPFEKSTIILFINNTIKVITKRTHHICCLMTITKDSHVCTELIPYGKYRGRSYE